MVTVPPGNRQLKVLRFFGVSIPDDISAGQAGHLIGGIMDVPANRERWDKYVYLTGDVGSESADFKPFDSAALGGVILPPGWSSAQAEREYREKIAGRLLKDGVPFDTPPVVVFRDRIFMFTGRCEFGTRTRCEQAVRSRGGVIPESNWLTHVIDYLVVGARGSERWKHRGYGWKIEAAVVERLTHGKPAIIAEDHWRSFL
jgi:hypothetical protein